MRDFGWPGCTALREFSQNEGFVLAWKSHGTQWNNPIMKILLDDWKQNQTREEQKIREE